MEFYATSVSSAVGGGAVARVPITQRVISVSRGEGDVVERRAQGGGKVEQNQMTDPPCQILGKSPCREVPSLPLPKWKFNLPTRPALSRSNPPSAPPRERLVRVAQTTSLRDKKAERWTQRRKNWPGISSRSSGSRDHHHLFSNASKDLISSTPPQTRLIIGIAGIPASGKSTLANLIVEHANAILKTPNVESEGRTEAIVVGLDGWHLTRAQLAAMPDPQLAKDKRGAHWTFDPDGYLGFVKNLRVPLSHSGSAAIEPIIAPSFDHAVKDPDPTGMKVYPWHRIVVIEGLYCFLSIGAWKEAGEILDERWLATVDFEEATGRIVDRHIISGVAGSIEVGLLVVILRALLTRGLRKRNGGRGRTTCPVSPSPLLCE